MKRHIILNFHGIGAPGRMLEFGEVDYWISVEQFVAVLDQVAATPADTRVDLTFDDGNSSDWMVAGPELAKRGLTATFFPLADRIDQPGSLGKSDIRALLKAGHHVGSHGAAHLDWTSLDANELSRELIWARERLAEVTGAPIKEAAIPFGRYRRRVLDALRAAGYARAYSSDGGEVKVDGTGFLMPRTSISRHMGPETVAATLRNQAGLGRRIRRVAAMAVKARI